MTIEDVCKQIEDLGTNFEFEDLEITLCSPRGEECNFTVNFTMDLDLTEYSYDIADDICKRQLNKSIENATSQELSQLKIDLSTDHDLYRDIYDYCEEEAKEKAEDYYEWSDFDDSADVAYEMWRDDHL